MAKALRDSIPAVRDSKGIGRMSPMEKVRKFFADSKFKVGDMAKRATRAKATRRVK